MTMNNHRNSSSPLLLICCLAALLAGFCACSSDRSADVRSLLSTIPSDASAVGVADIETILSGKAAASRLESLGQAGIQPSVGAFFLEGFNAYFTGFVANSDNFKKYVEAKTGEKFKSEGDFEICGNVAASSSQFWICLSSRNTVSSAEIRRFMALQEKQSALTLPNVADMADLKEEIQLWGDIRGCLNAAELDYATRASISMAIESIFSDATEFTASAKSGKGKLILNLTVLNSKGGIAGLNLPKGKIEADAITRLGGSASAFAAIGVSPELVASVREQTRSKGVSVLGYMMGAFSSLDGTVAMRANDKENLALIFTTQGSTADLTDLLSQTGFKTSKEGVYVLASKGSADQGAITAQEAAGLLKGAMAGIVADTSILPFADAETVSKSAVLLHPDKGGLAVEATIFAADPKSDLLLTLLEKIIKE